MQHSFLKFSLLLLSTILMGCVSIKPQIIEKTIALEETNLQKINGSYSNVAENASETQTSSLWKQINYLKKDSISNWKNHKVHFEFIDSKTIKARLLYKNNFVSERILKGKIKDNYFSVRRQLRVVGIPLLFFVSKDHKFEMGINDENQLVINRATEVMGMLLVMAAGNTQQFTGIYPRE